MDEFSQCIQIGPTLHIGLCGSASRVMEIIEGMFALSMVEPKKNAVPMDVYHVEAGQVADVLPSWINSDWISDSTDFELQMAAGPGRSCAAALKQQGNLTCSWFDDVTGRMGFVTANFASGISFCSVQTVLSPVLRDVLLQCDSLLLHAASLRSASGRGMLFLADGGGGKTTTALAMMFEGGDLMGDDIAVVTIAGDDIRLEGVPERMNLSRQTLAFFDELSDLHDNFDKLHDGEGRGKIPVLPADIPGMDFYRGSCTLDSIYRVHISDDGPRVEMMETSSALGLLMRACTFSPDQSIPASLAELLFNLSGSVKAYELYTGPCPRALAVWLNEIFK